mgnify:CR=1 FL=1
MRYDAIVAGASFAGLAVAGEIKGKVLLIDKNDIGNRPTSACTTLYSVIQKLGCEDSTLSVFEKVGFHTAFGYTEYKALEPFCTFDYGKFCRELAKHFDGEFLRANIKGIKGNTVLTDKGDFYSDCIADCTGWRAKLGTDLEPAFVDREAMFFGLQTEVDCEQDDVLRFFWDSRIVEFGYAWVFPAGKRTRFGLGSCGNKKSLKKNLARFVSSYGKEINGLYGGFIPYKVRKPVVGKIFLAGDSAGHAWPLTGEGARQAIYFGQRCGKIIQKVIDKKVSLDEGLEEYANFVKKHRYYPGFLLCLQQVFFKMPNWGVELAAKLFGRGRAINFVQGKYKNGLSCDFLKGKAK